MYKLGPALVLGLTQILQIVGTKNGTPLGMGASTLLVCNLWIMRDFRLPMFRTMNDFGIGLDSLAN